MLTNHGVNKIFSEPNSFDSKIYDEIHEISKDRYENYYTQVKRYLTDLRRCFPLIKINNYPYSSMHKIITLSGILITKEFMDNAFLKTDLDYQTYGLKVFIVFPENFEEVGIMVFDYHQVINFDAIPYEYRHRRKSEKGNYMICTHHPNMIKNGDPVISVLNSAWSLFIEYRKLERTGLFNLECLPHGYSNK